MNAPGKYRRFFRRLERQVGYWREVALTEFVADLTRRMDERRISRANLADKLGRSRAYVTQALRGDANLTLESLVTLAMAVDGVVHIHIADRGSATTWVDRPKGYSLITITPEQRYEEAAVRVPVGVRVTPAAIQAGDTRVFSGLQ